jgi:hypothetical protein
METDLQKHKLLYLYCLQSPQGHTHLFGVRGGGQYNILVQKLALKAHFSLMSGDTSCPPLAMALAGSGWVEKICT